MDQSAVDEQQPEQRPQITINVHITSPADPDPLFMARLRDAMRRRPPGADAMRVRLY